MPALLSPSVTLLYWPLGEALRIVSSLLAWMVSQFPPVVVRGVTGASRLPLQGCHIPSALPRYDPRFNSWIHLASMTQKRTHFSLSVFNGLLYAVGGRNIEGSLASMECYVPSTNQWQPKTPLEVARCCHASAVADGRVLVTGGYIGNAYSRSACAYDPAGDSWQELPSMSTPRGWHCAVTLGDRVYVMGGSQVDARGERVDVLAVECYSPATRQWSHAAPLPVGVSTAGASALLGRAYLVGGWNEGQKKYKKCIQCFHPELNEWTEDDELPEATVGVSCCTLSMPNHVTRESRASSVSSVPVSI